MTLPPSTSIPYSETSLDRARRAIRCAPFTLKLYQDFRQQGIFLEKIVGETGVQQGYSLYPLGELAAENDLLWLINVGVLRREVDGQGITDSFRLTPLGRVVVDEWAANEATWLDEITLGDRLSNSLRRWLRWPF
ncbi:Npun_F0494 family protein [Sodalinema gerasimenkoae]|uniref:Npun_F0494 family protein n=1 Tax=Sodalinema gerasimenkoae TaxID=2862348 RepID=UPI00135A59EC|nr:Npun_F0494 family protein [Sodalinema gerasimenkoae]